MAIVTINTINGTPPYTIYVCNTYLLNCVLVLSGVTSTPVTFETPSAYTYSPSVVLKIVDSQLCEYTQSYSCISQTPTPSFTVTPTYTPSNTSTPQVTPSNTQTPYTPTPTPTNTATQTITPTPTVTPQIIISDKPSAFLIIEPLSASTIIGQYMQSQGANFFGFSNGVPPPTNQVDLENEINIYLNFSGWGVDLPSLVLLPYPSEPYPKGNDIFGNSLSSFNFKTIIISASTYYGESWYTFFIPSGYTNGQYQKSIDLSTNSPNLFTQVNTNPTYYNVDFTYKNGNIYFEGTRMYTTFPSSEFSLNNTQNLYFKGSVVGT